MSRYVLVFPAHAGMSLDVAAYKRPPGSFPRTRGDEPRIMVRSQRHNRFSPHTRG